MLADTAMEDCPQLDILCVPGGPGVAALMEDEAALDFLRAQAPGLRYLTSVCTGALVLGAAGVARGKTGCTRMGNQYLLAPGAGGGQGKRRVRKKRERRWVPRTYK